MVKSTSKKVSIVDAQEPQCFWVNYGPVVKNLAELKKAVEEMSDEQYDYHTKRNGNNFTQWIADVFGEVELAKKLDRAKTRVAFVKALDKSLDI